jgi:DNA-directed RNA polymerase specialized sigma24 family protein
MTEISVEFLCALARLDEDDRELVVDRVVRGASIRSMSERFGLSGQAVRNRERKALDRLRGHLEDVGFVR